METVLFQMGKVASTAIAEALSRQGCPALQAHIATSERLQLKLQIMTNAGVSDAVADRMYQDYLQELRATFLVTRRRLTAAAAGAARLRLITLTRDPLSWYWSHFAQNYDHYQSLLQRFHRHHYGDRPAFDAQATFAEVQQILFQVLHDTRAPLDRADALPQLMGEADARDETNVVFSQLNRFLLPLRWFSEDFLPATDIDVLAHPFDRQAGVGHIESGSFSVLLLRYENLSELAGEIAAFVGIDNLDLQLANVSEDKNVPIDLREMQRKAQSDIPPGLLTRIYDTGYARHFGYMAPP